jgi:hypothetical protein
MLQIFKQPLTDSQLEAGVLAFGGRAAPGLLRKGSVRPAPSKELTFAVAQKVILALPHDPRAMRGLRNLTKMNASDRESLMECAGCMTKASRHLHKAADKHPGDDDLQNAVAHHDAGMFHLSAISGDLDLDGGTHSVDPATDATAPAKAVIVRDLTKRAGAIMREVRKQASLSAIDKSDQRRPGTALEPVPVYKAMEVAHQNPIPGHPLAGLPDTDPNTVDVERLRSDPTSRPETVAYPAMMAQKRVILADSRKGWH